MSDHFSTTTGLLVFAGEPKITLLVAALFNPFRLADDIIPKDEAYARYLCVANDENDLDWEAMSVEIEDYCLELGLDVPEGECAESLLARIGAHFSVDLKRVTEVIDFEATVDLADLLAICRAIPDGNNADCLRLMAGYHAYRPYLYEFGGSVTLDSPRYRLDIGTRSLLQYAETIDKALKHDEELVAATIGEMTEVFLAGVADPAVAERVRRRLAARLDISGHPAALAAMAG